LTTRQEHQLSSLTTSTPPLSTTKGNSLWDERFFERDIVDLDSVVPTSVRRTTQPQALAPHSLAPDAACAEGTVAAATHPNLPQQRHCGAACLTRLTVYLLTSPYHI